MPSPHEHDLELIDAALARGRASADDPHERELEELVLALRDEAPEPDPAFVHEMDRRVAAGFKRRRERRSWLPTLHLGMPALAGAAAALIVAVVTVALVSGGGGGDKSAPTSARAPSGGGAQGLTGGGAAAGASARRVQRSAQITISAPTSAAFGIRRAAQSHGGYVASATHTHFVLRVPVARLQATLGDIARLGHVLGRSQSAQDMTVPYRTLQRQLGDAISERRAALAALQTAAGTNADALRSRLRTLDARIRDLNGQLHSMRNRSAFATIDVTLRAER